MSREILTNHVYHGLIQAGFNFFTTLGGISATQIMNNPIQCLVASSVSAGLGFFISLIIQAEAHTQAKWKNQSGRRRIGKRTRK